MAIHREHSITCVRVLLFAGLLAGGVFGGRAHAAQVACTPTAGFTNCVRFTYSGGNQGFTVPAGVTSIEIRAWGAAGGGANSGYYTQQAGGAGGGFSTGRLAVTPGQSYIIVVGQGGVPNSTATTYGGGGAGGSTNGRATAVGGSGGGYSGMFLTSVSAANARIIAGGGGGASPGADVSSGSGGGGGTNGGQDASLANSGRGGTQTAGGAGASGAGGCGTPPTAGSALQGGNGGNSPTSNTWEGGGGGGGGWYGGGGGLCQTMGGSVQNGPGGGGSGYIAGTGLTSASTTAGQDFSWSTGACAGTTAPGGAANPLYTAGIGQGSCYGTGGNGEVTLQWNNPRITVTKTSVGGGGAFTFTGDNGWTSQIITTPAGGGSATGATQLLAAAGVATTLTETIPAAYELTAVSCTGLGAGGTYAPNLATGAVVFDAAAVSATANIACTFTNARRPVLRLQKTLPSGRFSAGDQFALSIAGAGGPATVTTTGTGATATGVATLAAGTVGASYTFAEAGAAGADLASYATSYACTNALSGGQTPSGTGTGFSVTAAAGDDLTCTFTNARNPLADVTVTKTNTPLSGPSDLPADTVVSGTAVAYSVVVGNNGPDAANGTVIRDPSPVGMSCATATCGGATGGASCPALTGAALLAALQSPGGAVIPALPSGGTLTFTVNCTID